MRLEQHQIQQFIDQLPEERQQAFSKLQQTVSQHLPDGFEESLGQFINYQVPLSTYPDGYHCTPDTPLPFISLANNKNFIALHHMGVYANPELLEWFQNQYPKHSKYKLNMGKSCIRFKYIDHIPYDLIAELMTKMSVNQWIDIYEAAFKK